MSKAIKVNRLDAMKKRLKEVAGIKVLVGIPEEKSSRSENSESINNAELLYIHSHGVRRKAMREEMKSDMNEGKKYSEAYALYIQSHGSPLWASPPRPVIEPAIEAHRDEVADALKSAIQQYISTGSDSGYRRAGMYGSSISKDWFEDSRNGWAPNSASTIEKKGSALPLIDTGAMRQAITYVIKKGTDI